MFVHYVKYCTGVASVFGDLERGGAALLGSASYQTAKTVEHKSVCVWVCLVVACLYPIPQVRGTGWECDKRIYWDREERRQSHICKHFILTLYWHYVYLFNPIQTYWSWKTWGIRFLGKVGEVIRRSDNTTTQSSPSSTKSSPSSHEQWCHPL